jgi:hypothetical protein
MKKQILLKISILAIICVISQNGWSNELLLDNLSFNGFERPTKSVLSTGVYYKLSVPRSGVYKITKSLLTKIGITQNIDPRNIRIYSNVGGHLAERNSESSISDLLEIPILVKGELDGSFDSSDEIYFYAEGASKWGYNPISKKYKYTNNIYDISNYVFLTVSSSAGKRITDVKVNDVATYETSEFDNVQIWEEDKINLLSREINTQGSGKQWFGDYFRNGESKNYFQNFNFTKLKPSAIIEVELLAASRSPFRSEFTLNTGKENGNVFTNSVNISEIESDYAALGTIDQNFTYNSDFKELSLRYNGNAPTGEAWLDYIKLTSRGNLVHNKDNFLFSDRNAIGRPSKFIIDKPTLSLKIWNVTELDKVQSQLIQSSSFNIPKDDKLQWFVAFEEASCAEPTFVSKIDNQNLHSISKADMLVVYPKGFEKAAQRIATHRSQYDGLNVVIASIEEVFNEYSSGRKDATALRNFARTVFERDSRFKYLLLLGDGTYDSRHITNNTKDSPFLPVFETDESIHPIGSFPSDDYFALLNDQEGGQLTGALDIAVGRIPVKTAQEADTIIAKVIRYDLSNESFGDWRSNVGFLADDEDYNIHLQQTDRIASKVETTNPELYVSKIYMDAFPQVSTPGGQRFPDVTQTLANSIFQGLLTLAYLGHGGPQGLAQERVLQINDIRAWNNRQRPTVLITATCSLTGYDNPALVTAGEEAILNPNGGAVALFSTVRSVYSSENERLTSSVFDFIYRKVDGRGQRFGDIFVRAKNNQGQDTLSENTRKFALIGDPAQRIALPTDKVELTHINGLPAKSFTDAVTALDRVTLRGEIKDMNNFLVGNFNGNINLTVFDKKSILETLANDGTSSKYKFDQYKNIVFKGSAKVNNGKWEISFVVPKDINYSIGFGKLSMYAKSAIGDANGYYDQLKIGGDIKNTIADDKGPDIKLFINDTTFVNGGITNNNPTLLIDLYDDNGINLTGNSIGHDLTANLIGPTKGSFILNEFYTSDINRSGHGIVRYPLSKLAVGEYTINVKAWDIANNSNTASISFRVIEKDSEFLSSIYAYPNPFLSNVSFSLEHPFNNDEIAIDLSIFNTSGKLVKHVTVEKTASGSRESDIQWDGKENWSEELSKGVYYYKIKIKSKALGVEHESKFQKMIKL